MLYDKSAVRNREPITREQVHLAQKHSPFRLDRKTREDIERKFRTRSLLLKPQDKRLTDITSRLHDILDYDENRPPFLGTKTAEEVWDSREGNCFEQNALLYAIATMHDVHNLRFLVAQNPHGYEYKEMAWDTKHAFLIRRNNRDFSFSDAVSGKTQDISELPFNLGFTILGFPEFVAFYLCDHAEELNSYERYQEALEVLDIAGRIDPNNYVIQLIKTDSFYGLGRDEYDKIGEPLDAVDTFFQKAEECFDRAREIAPGLADIEWYHAQFCIYAYERGEFWAKRCISKMRKLNSRDARIFSGAATAIARGGGLDSRAFLDLYKKMLNARNAYADVHNKTVEDPESFVELIRNQFS